MLGEQADRLCIKRRARRRCELGWRVEKYPLSCFMKRGRHTRIGGASGTRPPKADASPSLFLPTSFDGDPEAAMLLNWNPKRPYPAEVFCTLPHGFLLPQRRLVLLHVM